MNRRVISTLISLFLAQVIATASAGEYARQPDALAAVKAEGSSSSQSISNIRSRVGTPLDRIADAVDGAESSHGADLAMWRTDPSGPQGPMQVTEAAATDVGGGDRFDVTQNRSIGRAYLAQLYWRYRNWPDAIAAYNWGMSNVDAWVKAGRPNDKFLIGVAAYLRRVLHDSGLCNGSIPVRQASVGTPTRSRQPRQDRTAEGEAETDVFSRATCASLDAWAGAADGKDRYLGVASTRFYSKLERAMLLAMEHVPASLRSTQMRDERIAMQRP
jgi:Transglycosylase SLT domain